MNLKRGVGPIKANFETPNRKGKKSVKSDDDEMYLQAIITVFSHRELSAVSSDDLHSKNIK